MLPLKINLSYNDPRRSHYYVVATSKDDAPAGKFIWIVDEDGPLSVTNDAERVCREMHLLAPGCRIIYRDTDGNWDELVHRAGVFTGYAPARHLAPAGSD